LVLEDKRHSATRQRISSGTNQLPQLIEAFSTTGATAPLGQNSRSEQRAIRKEHGARNSEQSPASTSTDDIEIATQ
jgi:hypothetical protein